MDHETRLTAIIDRLESGDHRAAEELMPMLYPELRALAGKYFQDQPAQTLQPTALVHEAYVRLAAVEDGFKCPAHFLATAATAMRQILVDSARRRGAAKRGGGRRAFTIAEYDGVAEDRDRGLDLIALDEALVELGQLDRRQARIIELRFFAGLSVEQVAEVLGVSPNTVKRDWRFARAWLIDKLRPQDGGR